MFAVVVSFELKAGCEDQFHDAMIKQAENSLALEPDCHYFDVCREPGDPAKYVLYELYTDEYAFEYHLASEHFKSFNKQVSDWVDARAIKRLQRIEIGTIQAV